MGLVDPGGVSEEGQVMGPKWPLGLGALVGLVYAQAVPPGTVPVAPASPGPAARKAPSSPVRPKGVSAQSEQQLIARVREFYQLIRDGKMLAATEMVVADSKDVFLAGEKPKVESVEIPGLEWLEGTGQVKVSLVGQTSMFVAGQKIPSRTVFDSYWKLVNGRWMYFDPPVRERKTPFGVVKVDRDGNRVGGATVDLKAKIEAAKATAMPDANAFTVESRDLAFSKSMPGSAEFKVSNRSAGYVNVIFGGADLKGLEFVPATATVPPGQTGVFRVIWTPGEKPDYGQDWGAIIVQPWNRRTEFRIRWSD